MSMRLSQNFHTVDSSACVNSLDQVVVQDAIYMELADHVTRGNSQFRAFSKPAPYIRALYHFEYDCVQGPNCIDAVVLHLEFNGEFVAKLKYAKYWDNPEYWSNPFNEDVYKVRKKIQDPTSGKTLHRGDIAVRSKQLPEEEELYDLILDPTEAKNLATYDEASKAKHADKKGYVKIAVICKSSETTKKVQVESGILMQAVRNALKQQKKVKMRKRNTPYYFQNRNVHPHGEWNVPIGLRLIFLSPLILVLLICVVALS
mmetsp:Transcript_21906/g.26649  ORF Transcript_21906/g.26649 Transcript_21906/m.26649 type:complete len:259 (+) Transcript_21906:543-1319(+)